MDTPQHTVTGAAPQEAQGTPHTSRRRRWLAFILGSQLCVVLVLFGTAEYVAQRKGYTPWSRGAANWAIRPAPMVQMDPILGYRYRPGSFDVTLNGDYEFDVTHGRDGYRVTGPPRAEGEPVRPEVWVFGCSITHGWGLNDRDTYAWKLQEALPDYRVRNYGVGGYGTVHSLLQFRSFVAQRPPPALAILAYGDIHDPRNTFARTRRKAMTGDQPRGGFFPYARLRPDGTLDIRRGPMPFVPWPGMQRSAFVHLLESAYTRYVDGRQDSHLVSRGVVQALAAACREHQVPLLVAGITKPRWMLEYCRRQRIRGTDISVDTESPAYWHPASGHPNAAAHQVYADRILTYLRVTELLPPPEAP